MLIQAALEQMGGQAFVAWADGPSSPQHSALQMFSKFCDLIVTVSAADQMGQTNPALRMPRIYTVRGDSAKGCICVDSPSDATAALSSFLSFFVPLVRRMQGRTAIPGPAIHSAIDDGEPRIDEAMVWVVARG